MAKMFAITDWPSNETTTDGSPAEEVVIHTWNAEDQSGHCFRMKNVPHPLWAIGQILVEAGYEEMEYDEFKELGGST